jgi:hypothetical protein
MWNITCELILEIGIMEMRWNCMGRIWGVPSLFRYFLGIFYVWKVVFHSPDDDFIPPI